MSETVSWRCCRETTKHDSCPLSDPLESMGAGEMDGRLRRRTAWTRETTLRGLFQRALKQLGMKRFVFDDLDQRSGHTEIWYGRQVSPAQHSVAGRLTQKAGKLTIL